MKNTAVIDLGTNTFNLLIASQSGQTLYSQKIAVKLGKGGISKGTIAPDAFERALSAMDTFKQKASEYQAASIHAIGTSAMRNAQNGQELVDAIFEKTGICIKVISGDEEAELIYYGVRKAVNMQDTTSMIIDIGGGSVEFIIANQEEIFWKKSLEIGAQRLLDSYHQNDPVTQEEKSALLVFLQESLVEVSDAVNNFKPSVLVGSSGTFDTLAEMDILEKNSDYDYGLHKEYSLDIKDFKRHSQNIVSKTREERLNIPGMIDMRVDMIVVACILIELVIQEFGLTKIRISAYSLKEGILDRVLQQ